KLDTLDIRIFSFYSSGVHRVLHSFPTRRSSDLAGRGVGHAFRHAYPADGNHSPDRRRWTGRCGPGHGTRPPRRAQRRGGPLPGRSEEHTSELQSRGHLVCRLLLEKKKKTAKKKI